MIGATHTIVIPMPKSAYEAQDDAPKRVPLAQKEQSVAPANEYVPMLHCRQAVSPVIPCVGWNVPAGHAMAVPFKRQWCPVGHGTSADLGVARRFKIAVTFVS